MIKGVNRQIIEIHDTGSKLFDKALLFVNANEGIKSEAQLKNEAQRILRSYAIGELPDIRLSKRGLGKIKPKTIILGIIFALVFLSFAFLAVLYTV